MAFCRCFQHWPCKFYDDANSKLYSTLLSPRVGAFDVIGSVKGNEHGVFIRTQTAMDH